MLKQLVFRTLSRFLAGTLMASAVVACATKPTEVHENPDRRIEGQQGVSVAGVPSGPLDPIRVTEDTVIIDARTPFEYSAAHIPRSIQLNWADYTEPEPAQRGIIQRDVFAAARRLARFGVHPQSKVVVVGRGLEGNGEEGRVAWMLAYLGVPNVRFADIDSLGARLTNLANESAPASAPIWKPEPVQSLDVTRAELLFVVNKSGMHKPVAFREGDEPTLYRIIDVRSAKAYQGREGLGAKRKIPNMDAINIPWRELFDEALGPKLDIKAMLTALGIEPSHRIIVLDEDGVSSAAVTMALRAYGYDKAGNYSGGLKDLLSAYPQKK